jgi:hypothetical protein
MTFYENVPLRPAIMSLLIAVADGRHADLKNDLENNYASAGQYLLRLIEYRRNRTRGAVNKPGAGFDSRALASYLKPVSVA